MIRRIQRKVKLFIGKLQYRILMFNHKTITPWFRAHKEHTFFKYFEHANWFKWYGRKLVHVKSKDPSKLSATEAGVKEAIQAKDYARAYAIVKDLPETPKTITLKQVIESKL